MLGLLSLKRLRGGFNLAIPLLSSPARRQSVANRKKTVIASSYNVPRAAFMEVSDRRRFHPEGVDRPAVMLSGSPVARLVVGPDVKRGPRRGVLPWTLAFANPSRTMICVRRRERREVIHALGVAGSHGLRPPSRNWTSDIVCK